MKTNSRHESDAERQRVTESETREVLLREVQSSVQVSVSSSGSAVKFRVCRIVTSTWAGGADDWQYNLSEHVSAPAGAACELN